MKDVFDAPENPAPALYREISFHFYTEDVDLDRRLRLAAPREPGDYPVVIFFPGGGLTSVGHECPRDLFDGRRIVVEPRYRLSPAVRADAIIDDAAAAVAWVFRRIADFGGDPARIFLGGMSAGAYLAAMIGLERNRLAAFGLDCRRLAGLLLVSGQMTTHFQVKADLAYPGDRYLPVIDCLAPLFHLSPAAPPVLAVTGDAALDIPARAAENRLLVASLRAMGHRRADCFELPGLDHGGVFDSCDRYLLDFMDCGA